MPFDEADTSCTTFLYLIGAQLQSSLNWISSQSTQLFRISMNSLYRNKYIKKKNFRQDFPNLPAYTNTRVFFLKENNLFSSKDALNWLWIDIELKKLSCL